MKTLKISNEKALELYKTASNELKQILEESFGVEFFELKKITDIVFNIETLCDYLDIDESKLFIFPKNTKDLHERYINACNIIPKITNVYNQGTILDFKNSNQYKYLPYKYLSGGSLVVGSGAWDYFFVAPGSFYYKDRLLAEKAFSNFKDIYEDYWNLK